MTLRSISIEVADLERAVDFWRAVTGGEFREVITRGRSAMFGRLGTGVTLKLVLREEGSTVEPARHVLGVAVTDVDAVIARVAEFGAKPVGEILRHDGRVHARIRDAEGNEFELYTA